MPNSNPDTILHPILDPYAYPIAKVDRYGQVSTIEDGQASNTLP